MSDKPYIERTGGSYVRDPATSKVRLQTPPTEMRRQDAKAEAEQATAPEAKSAPADASTDKKGK